MRKETCDSKQQRINDCGNGLGMLFLNEKEVTTKDIVQVATDEYSEKEVTRYQYDIEELRIDKAVTEANILEALIQKVAAKAEEYSDTSAVKSFTLLGAVTSRSSTRIRLQPSPPSKTCVAMTTLQGTQPR